ncbi:hypothetical protein ACE6H2_026750 [Prunus campanulata]
MPTIQKPLSLLFHIFLFSSLPLITTASSSPTPRAQAEALIKWKRSFSSSSSSSPPSLLHSWSLTNINNLCNWTGIVCGDHTTKTRTVSKIDLSNMNMTGTLTRFDFIRFPNLTHFNLFNNNFSGQIPSSIGNLTSLTFLDLGNNFFDQEIPSEIGRLAELQYLSFHNNSLYGAIPYQLSHLQKHSEGFWQVQP